MSTDAATAPVDARPSGGHAHADLGVVTVEEADLEGRRFLVTGATSGIGQETVRRLHEQGATVFLHGRTEASAAAAVSRLVGVMRGPRTVIQGSVATASTREDPGGELIPVHGDLSEMRQVLELADQVKPLTSRLDVLINNAGCYKRERALTADGLETTFAVNHLAPFLLTRRLLPLIQRGEQARIVNVTSEVHRSGRVDPDHLPELRSKDKAWNGWGTYCDTKLMNVLFTYRLARKLGRPDVGVPSVDCVHPGVVDTGFPREFGVTMRRAFERVAVPVEEGAKTTLHVATAPGIPMGTGRYFASCRERRSSARSYDESLQDALWTHSERLVDRST